jgi:hypothetical protein
MEQSWNNVRAKTLDFSTLAPKHCSIDFEILFSCAPSSIHPLACTNRPSSLDWLLERAKVTQLSRAPD